MGKRERTMTGGPEFRMACPPFGLRTFSEGGPIGPDHAAETRAGPLILQYYTNLVCFIISSPAVCHFPPSLAIFDDNRRPVTDAATWLYQRSLAILMGINPSGFP